MAVRTSGEALAKVARAYAHGLEVLDNHQHTLNLLLVRFNPGTEGEVVHHGLQVAAQVAVVVQAADYERGDFVLVRCQVAEAELALEALGEAFLDGEGVILGPWVLAPVVYLQFVCGDVSVFLHGVYGDFAAVFFGGVGIGLVVKHGIAFQLCTYLLLQFLNG